MVESKKSSGDAWVLFATILPSSMAFIDQSALNIILPAIQSSLRASGAELLWFVNGYTLMLASLILTGGTLGDRLGRKQVFAWGIALFTAASAGCAAAPTPALLVVTRLIQGVGGALMIPGSLSIISTHFPLERRGRAIGTWSAATTITTAAGPVLGGFLAQAGLWRGVFLINVPLGILALVALLRRVPADKEVKRGGRIDLIGLSTITVSLAGIAFGFIEAPSLGFASPQVLVAFATGVAALVVFLFAEGRGKSPMVPLDLFRSIRFSGANLLTFFLYGALGAFSLFLPLAMVQAQGYTERQAGLTLLPFVVLLAGMSRWAGALSDRIGPRVPLMVGPFLVGVGFFVCSLAGPERGAADYWRTYFPGIVLFGLGMGTTVAPLTTTVMSSLSEKLTGTASGVNNAVSRVAGVLAVAVLGAIALFHFSSYVTPRLTPLGLPKTFHEELLRRLKNLGDASVPAGVSASDSAAIKLLLRTGFLDTVRLVMDLCAISAWASGLLAAVFLRRTRGA